jgi:hypothetical protein
MMQTDLSPEDLQHFISTVYDPNTPQAGRLFAISFLVRLARVYPNVRRECGRHFAPLLLLTEEPPIAERLTQALLDLRVKEAAGYIQLAYQRRVLAPNFAGGWKRVQTRLKRAAPLEPIDLPPPQADPNEFWRALLFGSQPSSPPLPPDD